MIQPFLSFLFFLYIWGQDSRLFVLNPLDPVPPGPGVAVDDLQKQTEIFSQSCRGNLIKTQRGAL